MARICYWRYIVPLAVIFQDIETGVDQEVDPDMRLLLLSPSSFNVGLTALPEVHCHQESFVSRNFFWFVQIVPVGL
jgi:hypothetical protein